jgi:deoxyribonuclease V
MNFPELHRWDMTPKAAIALQKQLAKRIRLDCRLTQPVRYVAGVDVSYRRGGNDFFAAVVVLQLPELKLEEQVTASGRVTFPYVPGLLSFRELPVVLQAFGKLHAVPDAVLVDGQGIAHPRRFGIASHLGLWLDLPTVGCAKSRLCGEHDLPGRHRGDRVPLVLESEPVGTVLTTRDNIKPLYVSPGHLLDVPTAAELVMRCLGRCRLPEPTRLAHLLANEARRNAKH